MDGGEIDGNVSINIIIFNKPPSCKARHHYIVDIAIAERWPWLFWIQFNGSTIVIISPLYKWHWQCSGGFYEKGGLVESRLMVKSCWQLSRDTDDTPSFSSFHSDAKLRALHNLSQFLHWRNCARAEICHKFKYKDFPVANSCHKYKYASPACLSLGTSTPTSSWLYATVTNSNTDTDTNAEMQKKANTDTNTNTDMQILNL